MKYKKATQLLLGKEKMSFLTLNNVVFSCYQPEKQIQHLMRIKLYLSEFEDSEVEDFVEYLKKDEHIKNCLDGHELPKVFVKAKEMNSLHYGCYVVNAHIYVQTVIAWLEKKAYMADVIKSYRYVVELN